MRLPRLTVALIPLLLAAGVAPAHAQIDLSGIWAPIFHEDQPERIPGPEIGDYSGLPITDAARMRAETWDASLLTIPEHQCRPHPSTYGFRGVGNLRIWNVINDETQQLVSIRTHIQWQEQEREVFMDNRAAPPDFAAHTWQGFSKGHWEGNVLVVETDHLKAGWVRRNGLPLSDRAHMTERFIRHGDILTHVYIIEDPVYLSEPLVKTNGFQLTTNLTMAPYPCESVIEVPREEGAVPHNLPGQNSYWDDFAKKHNLPIDATRGGAETALPEFGKRLRSQQSGGAR
jgi:hypothetical protein